MSRATIILDSKARREQAARWCANAPPGTRVTFAETKRSLPQNDKMWAMLTEIAQQAEWAGKKRTTTEWKDLFTGAVKVAGGLEAVPGLEGGLMILGLHTSDMTVAEMADLITYMESWGAANGVEFSDGQGTSGANNSRRAA